MLNQSYESRFVSARTAILCVVIIAAAIGFLPLIQFAVPLGQPAIAQENEIRKTPKQTKPLTEGVNYLIIPLTGAQTDLQKTLVSSKKGADVLIDGTAIVGSDGTINGNALLLDQLRKDLQPLADRKQNVLNVHIYYGMVGDRNAKDLLYFSLQGFGRHAGFQTTKVFNHFQGQRFRFEDLVTSRKKSIEVGDEGDEPVSGNELVKVYPVRTSLSRSKSVDADCVVEILPRFEKDYNNALPSKIDQAIRLYVSKLEVKQKRKMLFKVTSKGEGRKTIDWFIEREGAKKLAQSLGYQSVSVQHTPY